MEKKKFKLKKWEVGSKNRIYFNAPEISRTGAKIWFEKDVDGPMNVDIKYYFFGKVWNTLPGHCCQGCATTLDAVVKYINFLGLRITTFEDLEKICE